MIIGPSSMGSSGRCAPGLLGGIYGFWQMVASRFWHWREAGIWDRVLAELRRQADAEAGRSTMWTAPQCELTSTQPVQKGGFSTKVRVKAEGKGKLMALVLTPGERYEDPFFSTVDGRRARVLVVPSCGLGGWWGIKAKASAQA